MGVSPTGSMLPMNHPRCIFIKCNNEWSYNYIGGIKEFIPLAPATTVTFHTLACNYITLRHNFCTGHIDNQSYTHELNTLFKTLLGNTQLDAVVRWNCETLYRLVRPVLSVHHNPISKTTYTQDSNGELIGLIINYQQWGEKTSMQVI